MFPLEEIEQHLGSAIQSIQNLHGGSINEVKLIDLGHDRLVVKYNAHPGPGFFAAEADGLAALRRASSLAHVPQVVAIQEKWMAMEYFEPTSDHQNWELLAASLRELHAVRSSSFGWHQDNYIGSQPQTNRTSNSFASFFMGQRIQPMIERCGHLLEPSDVNALLKLPVLWEGLWSDSEPSLVHGDLWSGNFFFTFGGRPVLIDPSVSNSIAQVDIGMTKLFGGFHPHFYDAYYAGEVEELEQMKCDLCNLYPILVHIYLFGLSYRRLLRDTLRQYGLLT